MLRNQSVAKIDNFLFYHKQKKAYPTLEKAADCYFSLSLRP